MLSRVFGPRFPGAVGGAGAVGPAYTLERAMRHIRQIIVSGYRRWVLGLTAALIAGISSTRPRAPFFR